MSDAPITAVRKAIAALLDDVEGLHAYAEVPADPRPPFAAVGWPRIRYGAEGPTEDRWTLPIQLGVGVQSNTSATRKLEELVARRIVKDTLEQAGTGLAALAAVWVPDVETGYDPETGALTAVFNVELSIEEQQP